jgi:hypothetical protein
MMGESRMSESEPVEIQLLPAAASDGGDSKAGVNRERP